MLVYELIEDFVSYHAIEEQTFKKILTCLEQLYNGSPSLFYKC